MEPRGPVHQSDVQKLIGWFVARGLIEPAERRSYEDHYRTVCISLTTEQLGSACKKILHAGWRRAPHPLHFKALAEDRFTPATIAEQQAHVARIRKMLAESKLPPRPSRYQANPTGRTGLDAAGTAADSQV